MSICCCTGKCKVPPYTCSVQSIPMGGSGGVGIGSYGGSISVVGSSCNYDLEIQSVRSQVNAQEHSINHTQIGLERCFEKIEALEKFHKEWKELPKMEVNKKCHNPFEFIAVDAKRRDDIRHIKNSLYDLYCWILENVEDNSQRSKGIECLESAAMWLNKAISRRKDDGTQT